MLGRKLERGRKSGRGGSSRQSGSGSGRPRSTRGPPPKPKPRTSLQKVAKAHSKFSGRVKGGMKTIKRTTDRAQQSKWGQRLGKAAESLGKDAKGGIFGRQPLPKLPQLPSFRGKKKEKKENNTESGPPTSTVRGSGGLGGLGALRRLGSATASAAGNVRSAAGNVSSAARESARKINETRQVYTQVGTAVARGMIGKKSDLTSPRPPPASLRPGHRTWAYAE